jgi:osmotically-inducible protein OsmY
MRPFRRFSTATSVVLLATIGCLSGCRVAHNDETAGQYLDDTTVKARAKAALIGDKEVSSDDFTIDVYQGRVTLTGVTKSAQESKRAEEDIRKVPGVKSVQNEVRIAQAERSATQR